MTTSPTDRAAFEAWIAKRDEPFTNWTLWQAATAAERERRRAELSAALQCDLEHGVKWVSEKAAADFASAYPALAAAIRSGA